MSVETVNDEPRPPADEPRAAWWWPVAAVLGLIAVAVVAALVLADDEDDVATGVTTTTVEVTTSGASSTAAPTTTAAVGTTATSSPPPPVTTPVVPEALRPSVWPTGDTARRFDDPVAAARSFAVELVGFADPQLGEFRQGDARSGEVEVRASADGPATTVFVRQLADDDSWWVLGSATADIEVTEPAALGAIDHPLQVSGRARAGTLEVRVLADGTLEPVGQGIVTTRGDGELGSFDASVPFTSPRGGWGAVVFLTRSADDGRVQAAGVVRVGFIGGD